MTFNGNWISCVSYTMASCDILSVKISAENILPLRRPTICRKKQKRRDRFK